MTTTVKSSGRHLDLSLIEQYLSSGVGGILAIDGSPPGQIVVAPGSGTLALRFRSTVDGPDVVEFENVSVRVVLENGVRWHQMTIDIGDRLSEVYAVICSLVDMVQVEGRQFGQAVVEVLESLSDLLSQRSRMTIGKQIGLFGELVTLRAIAQTTSGPASVETWRGTNEEHDFGLQDIDLEVKSTLGERRHHWISSATQLVPTGTRPLLLVSLQFTAAPSNTGATLPELVSRARDDAGGQLDRLQHGIRFAGYQSSDSELYASRWVLRTPPAFFRVDESFPALTQGHLDNFVPAAERIVDLRYRLNLDNWAQVPEPFSMNDVLQGATDS